MQFRLCEPCWRSRPLSAFTQKNKVCKECRKGGVKSYRAQYYEKQSLLPEDQRFRICNLCVEELCESTNFEISNGNYRSECRSCRGQRAWKKIVEKGGYSDQRRETYNKAMRRYNKRRKSIDPDYVLAIKFHNASYRAKKNSIEDLMPDDWWNILLEICEYRCLKPGCEKKINETNPLSHDHVIPVSIEGSIHSLGNSQVLCKSCNSSKQNRNSDDYRTEEMKQKLEAYDQLKLNSDIDIVL